MAAVRKPKKSLADSATPSARLEAQPQPAAENRIVKHGMGMIRDNRPRNIEGDGIGQRIKVDGGVILTCVNRITITPHPNTIKKEHRSKKKMKKARPEEAEEGSWQFDIYEASDSHELPEGNCFVGISNLAQILGHSDTFPSKLIKEYKDNLLSGKIKTYKGRGKYVNLYDLWYLPRLKSSPKGRDYQPGYQRWLQLRTQISLCGERIHFSQIKKVLNLEAIIDEPTFPTCFTKRSRASVSRPDNPNASFAVPSLETKTSDVAKRKKPDGPFSADERGTKRPTTENNAVISPEMAPDALSAVISPPQPLPYSFVPFEEEAKETKGEATGPALPVSEWGRDNGVVNTPSDAVGKHAVNDQSVEEAFADLWVLRDRRSAATQSDDDPGICSALPPASFMK